MKEKQRDILVTVSWAVITASIILQTLLKRPLALTYLTALDLSLLFVVSVLAGAILVDPGTIIFSYVGSLSLSILIVFICLTLPAILETTPLGPILYDQAIIMIFIAIFPVPLVLCLMGVFIGGIIGEALRFR